MKFKVRPTGILIEDDKILLLEQKVNNERSWSLPGGTLEPGESIEECLTREFFEETGLKIKIIKQLYICDRINENNHVVHITFMIEKVGGKMILGYEPEDGANKIKDIQFIDIENLERYGFSVKFKDLVKKGFPDSGNYLGDIKNIGL